MGKVYTNVLGRFLSIRSRVWPGFIERVGQALTLQLVKGGGQKVALTEKTDMVGAKAGAQPGGAMGRQVTVIADVVALDAATQTVTLKGPNRTVDLAVKDPAQFKRIAKGDQVEAKYTQAVALSVEPAVKK